MAIIKGTNVSPFKGPQNNQQNDSWKSQAFLNLYLPTQSGGRRKLGSIGLKVAKEEEAKLIAWLEEDPSRVGIIKDKLMIEFNPAEVQEDNGFDLSLGAPAVTEEVPVVTEELPAVTE